MISFTPLEEIEKAIARCLGVDVEQKQLRQAYDGWQGFLRGWNWTRRNKKRPERNKAKTLEAYRLTLAGARRPQRLMFYMKSPGLYDRRPGESKDAFIDRLARGAGAAIARVFTNRKEGKTGNAARQLGPFVYRFGPRSQGTVRSQWSERELLNNDIQEANATLGLWYAELQQSLPGGPSRQRISGGATLPNPMNTWLDPVEAGQKLNPKIGQQLADVVQLEVEDIVADLGKVWEQGGDITERELATLIARQIVNWYEE